MYGTLLFPNPPTPIPHCPRSPIGGRSLKPLNGIHHVHYSYNKPYILYYYMRFNNTKDMEGFLLHIPIQRLSFYLLRWHPTSQLMFILFLLMGDNNFLTSNDTLRSHSYELCCHGDFVLKHPTSRSSSQC